MKKLIKIRSIMVLLAFLCYGNLSMVLQAQTVSTFAGGLAGNIDGVGSLARFYGPYGIAVDASGNLYVSDQANNKIRKITPLGETSSFAGTTTAGSTDGSASLASFSSPAGLAIDASGNLYVADINNHKIRKITPSGVVSTFAGTGIAGSLNGSSTSATFNALTGLAIDASGNIYVADANNHKIRKITPSGVVSTFAGTGAVGSTNGIGTSASFYHPLGVAVDGSGNVYVADQGNNKIRKITPSGMVSTFAGTGSVGSTDGAGTSASFNGPSTVTLDNFGNILVVDRLNHKIRMITPAGIVSTLAGTNSGSIDGVGTLASFNTPKGAAFDALGNLYVADYGNNKIRKITPCVLPIISTNPISQTVCTSTIASFSIVASGDGLIYQWKKENVNISGATSPTLLLNNVSATDAANYSCVVTGNCGTAISTSASLIVQTTTAPITTAQSFCGNQNPTVVQLMATGEALQWYTASIGGSSLSPSAALSTATYYVSQTVNACEGLRASANVTIQNTTAPITTAQSFCANQQTPTVALLTATGTMIKWYTASIGGIALASNTVLTTATYYASQTLNGCEGPRASANVTVQNTIAPITTAQSFCVSQNPSVAQLTATGTAIKWYTTLNGGATLSNVVALATGIYYASQTVNGCESSRTSASVILQTSALPTASAQSFCTSQNPTVAQLMATGIAIKWYTASIGGTALSDSEALITGTYYASQTINGCESSRVPVSVTFYATGYTLSDVDAACSSSFAVPVQTVGTIKNGLIGLDFTLNYDQTLVTPTGSASLGAVANAYGDYSLNTSTPGQVVVSVYLKNAPSNTFFNGIGNIISINFTVKAGVAINTTAALTTSLIEESTVIGAVTTCNASPSILKVVGVVGGKIIYRDDDSKDLGYNVSNPLLYNPTVITSYGSDCTTPIGTAVLPNNTGLFSYNPGNGSALKIERDIKGNFNLPTLECTNVQSVINNADYQLALTIANSSYSTPSLYELMAADVNQDGKVTAGDASLISSRSINQYNCEFPQAWNYEWNGTNYAPKSTYTKSKDWIFVPDVYATNPSFVLNMGRNQVPQLPACLPSPLGVASCTVNANTIYHAVLLGDVNANWSKTANGNQLRESSSNEIFFDLPNAIVNGSFKTIPVYYSGTSFNGIDFSLDYSSHVKINKITGADGVTVQWNDIADQRLMVSANASEALTGKYPVLYLTVTTNDELTAESFGAASGYLNGENATMRFEESPTSIGFGLQAEIFPNPSNDKTYIHATDASAFVKVSIYMSDGLLVYENIGVPANEDVVLPDLKAGMYVLKVSGTNGDATKKLVRY